jgi:hypothetical protein
MGEDLYVWMPADLDQFGRKDSDGTVVGGKSLVKLGHLAANGWRPIDQVNLKPRGGKVKRGLNPAHSSADHHHISNLTACGTLIEPFFFHFLFPHLEYLTPPKPPLFKGREGLFKRVWF